MTPCVCYNSISFLLLCGVHVLHCNTYTIATPAHMRPSSAQGDPFPTPCIDHHAGRRAGGKRDQPPQQRSKQRPARHAARGGRGMREAFDRRRRITSQPQSRGGVAISRSIGRGTPEVAFAPTRPPSHPYLALQLTSRSHTPHSDLVRRDVSDVYGVAARGRPH